MLGTDYQCSHCGCWAPESNSGHYDKLTNFCSSCGALMIESKTLDLKNIKKGVSKVWQLY